MTEVQFVKENGEPRYAIIPIADYNRMIEALEDEDDLEVLRQAQNNTSKDYIPLELAEQVWNGANPVRVWRKHRGLTQAELASRCDLARPYIAQIETGKRDMSVETLRRMADVLETNIEFLLPHKPAEDE